MLAIFATLMFMRCGVALADDSNFSDFSSAIVLEELKGRGLNPTPLEQRTPSATSIAASRDTYGENSEYSSASFTIGGRPTTSSATLGMNQQQQSSANDLTLAFIRYDADCRKGIIFSEDSASVREFNAVFANTAINSFVKVRTAEPGARIKCQLIGTQSVLTLPQLTNNAQDKIPIGFYFIWAERGDKVTSQREQFRIIQPKVILDVEEVLR